ncbi:MAG: DMT family transporter [Firmicutes bacterium]|nr:DMT family transporter [Bacillota bacterium]
MDKKRLFGNLILFVTAMIWGLAFVFQREGMDHIGPFTFTAGRMILSSLVLLPTVMGADAIAKKQGRLASRTMEPQAFARYKKDTLTGGVICGLLIVFANTAQQIGLISTSAGKAGFITALYVLLVPFLGYLIFRKKPRLIEIAAVCVGTFGLYLLCMSGGFRLETGDIYLLFCAFVFALYILCCDYYANKADVIRISFIQFAVSAAVLTVIAVILEHPTWEQIRPAAVGIVYCGVFSGGVGYTCQIIGQKYAEPTEASLIMCLESVFSVLFGWMLLNEALSARELLGCVIMFAAIVAVQIPVGQPGRRMRRAEE